MMNQSPFSTGEADCSAEYAEVPVKINNPDSCIHGFKGLCYGPSLEDPDYVYISLKDCRSTVKVHTDHVVMITQEEFDAPDETMPDDHSKEWWQS